MTSGILCYYVKKCTLSGAFFRTFNYWGTIIMFCFNTFIFEYMLLPGYTLVKRIYFMASIKKSNASSQFSSRLPERGHRRPRTARTFSADQHHIRHARNGGMPVIKEKDPSLIRRTFQRGIYFQSSRLTSIPTVPKLPLQILFQISFRLFHCFSLHFRSFLFPPDSE